MSVGSKLWTDNLPADATVQTTATASDGSVYVLADVTGSVSGQSIHHPGEDMTLEQGDKVMLVVRGSS